jgi:hypothetical protein
MTAELSPELDARARKNGATILQALAAVGQVEVAKRLKVSESTVSRYKDKDGQIEEIGKLLAAMGLKVVPGHFECEDPQELASLRWFSRRYLELITASRDAGTPAKAQGLQWD